MVRLNMTFDPEKYYNGYLAPLLEQEEIAAKSNLVQTLKNGQQKVNRDDLRKKYPIDKLAIVDYTLAFPGALNRYRQADTSLTAPPLDHDSMSGVPKSDPPNFLELMEAVEAIAPGPAGATSYHRAVEALLTAIFYPSLGNIAIEAEIHQGRKRIDIRYDNIATLGFFHWLLLNYRATTIAVECKNYKSEVGNPELDQLSGRFSPHRGQVGILTCRAMDNKDRFIRRCRDTADDHRGFIICLDDADLRALAEAAQQGRDERRRIRLLFPLLRERFGHLID